MKKMASLLFSVLMFMIISTQAMAVQKVEIYGDASYPPYSYEDNKMAKGIYVDVLTKAFSKMPEYEVSIKPIPWKRGLKMVEEGKSAGIFPPYYSKDREPWMSFSEPILQEKVVVFAKPSFLKGKTRWPEDFMGFKAGLNRGFNPGSMAGEAFAQAIKQGKITLDEGDSNEICLKKLDIDRLDFYLNDQMIDISAFPSVVRGITAQVNNGHIGFPRNDSQFPFLKDFEAKFNSVIKEMKTSGEIDAIVNTYIKK